MPREDRNFQKKFQEEENTPLVMILETKVDDKMARGQDARGSFYDIRISKASFGGIHYPTPGSRWYVKKIANEWVLMARAAFQNPQLGFALTPEPGDTFIGGEGTTTIVGDLVVTGSGGGSSLVDGDYGDITVSGSGSVWTIDADVVTNAKLANMAQNTIKGRALSAGTGDPTDLTQTQAVAVLAAGASAPPSITTAGAVGVATSVALSDHTHDLAADVVTNAKLANMAADTIKGRANGAGTGDPTDLTETQVTTILNNGASAPPSITTAGAVGTAASLARSDHTHDLAANVVTNAKMATMAADTIKGRANGAGTGDPTDLSLTQAVAILNNGAAVGASVVTTTATVGTANILARSDHVHNITDDAVTNAKLANVATQTFKGRTTASTGDPEDLTLTEARALMQDPNCVSTRFIHGSAINTTSTSYADFGTSISISFVKRHGTSTKLAIRVDGTWFFADGSAGTGGGGTIGVRVNSVDYDMAVQNKVVPTLTRVGYSGGDSISGLAANTYTVQARWKAQTSGKAVSVNTTDDYITLTVMEVWA